ncbi:hypothetical protein [Streptomyces sp. NPDC058335]|uniref:hypothetical protein n=1 Tax=Streptomyces sp. NPDC058335 TaxID=3346451 RepID=UPI00364A5C07
MSRTSSPAASQPSTRHNTCRSSSLTDTGATVVDHSADIFPALISSPACASSRRI